VAVIRSRTASLLVAGALAFLGFPALVGCRSAALAPIEDDDASAAGGIGGLGGSGGAGDGGAGASASAAAGGQGPVRGDASVMTWNLENFPLTPDALSGAAAILEAERPDVVALQEIAEPSAFDELLQRLGDYEGVLNDDPGAYTHLGLLYRRDRVSLDEVETLFQDDWYPFPRPPLKAQVTIAPDELGGEPFDFVVVVLHLKAQVDAESQARRLEACQELDAWVRARLAGDREQDYVLLGDMNDKLTDPPDGNVFQVFLDDPTLYRFLTLPLAEAGAHSYIPFEAMIDHVLVTADALDEVGSGETEVLALDESLPGYRDISDHRPVRTWLRR
jgi:endonuclease/exonuclease/phosphatase family metal-dependent hydrolase